MSHWSDAYIGRPYIPGVADCMHLAEEIAVDVLKINPKLPQTHEASLRKQAEQIDSLKADYAIKVCERSEERRVGKEGEYPGAPEADKNSGDNTSDATTTDAITGE